MLRLLTNRPLITRPISLLIPTRSLSTLASIQGTFTRTSYTLNRTFTTTSTNDELSTESSSIKEPIISIPSPLVPEPVILARNEILHLDDVTEAISHIQAGRYNAAKNGLWRALQILANAPDPYVRFAVERLLAWCCQCEGDLNGEFSFRARMLGAVRAGEVNDPKSAVTIQSTSAILALSLSALSQCSARPDIQLPFFWDHVKEMLPKSDVMVLLAIPAAERDSMQVARIKQLVEQYVPDSIQFPFPEATVGEWHLLKGDVYTHLLSSPEDGQREYEAAISILSEPDRLGAVPLQRGGIQCPLAVALLKRGGDERVSEAIALTEHCLGTSHPSLAIALHYGARDCAKRGEAIEAEGLQRAAINKLTAHLENQSALVSHFHVCPSVLRTILVQAMMSYSDLLSHMEWNNKPRTS